MSATGTTANDAKGKPTPESRTEGVGPNTGAQGTEVKKTEEEAGSKPSLLEATTSNTSTTEWLREYMSVAMGLKTPESLLDEVSFEGIARYIQSDKCQKIVTLAGAGISTSAGIPDFRSPGTGVYDRLKEFDIPDPKRVFELDYFKEHPEIVYTLRKDLMLGTFKPTPCHYFVKLLHDKKKLIRHFTQNIDGLELDAGMDTDSVVQAHGTCRTYHCMECQHPYTKQHMTEVLGDDSLKVPKCEQKDCDGVIRPDIVFFGESLPKTFAERTKEIPECDMMIIMGTSLVVQPFASLTSMTKSNVPRLYINLEKTGDSNVHPLTALIFGGGFDFDKENNIRDIFWQGTCDDGCYALADLLGWGDELKQLVKTEHAKIDKKLASVSKTPQNPPTSTARATANHPSKTHGSESTAAPTKTALGVASKSGANASSESLKPTSTSKTVSVPKANATSKPASVSKPSSTPRPVSVSKAGSGAKSKTPTGRNASSRK